MRPAIGRSVESGIAAGPVDFACRELRRASALAAADGVPGTEARGGLLRPLVAMAGLSTPGDPPTGFWDAVLAVQLAHEASLIHDDIVDGSGERRGAPSRHAAEGVPRAIVEGDHLLTGAYRAAARSRDLEFVALFARAVERTVAGEIDQGRAVGVLLDSGVYRRIALAKSGELFGCALAAAPVLVRRDDSLDVFEIGRRIGLVYQMLDDLLDYCPRAATGKPAMADFRGRRWTWVAGEIPGFSFAADAEDVLDRFHSLVGGQRPADRAVARLAREAEAVSVAVAGTVPGSDIVLRLLDHWTDTAAEAVAREADVPIARRGPTAVDRRGSNVGHARDGGHRPPRGAAVGNGVAAPRGGDDPGRPRAIPHPSVRSRPSAELVARVPEPREVDAYLAAHSRSFRFASRFFPPADARRVARVYAYCRVTDDLVDRPIPGPDPEMMLDEWTSLSRDAYDGSPTGIALLDAVMAEMAASGIPFTYVVDLADGMRMDLRRERYDSMLSLRRYTYRVASVVGLWLTRLFGVTDGDVLARAERMGHAMQLTNILRDVGEDWRRGRLYLPADRMAFHGVAERDLDRHLAAGPIGDAYRALIEELIGIADRDYDAAFEALPRVPLALARPAAVAAYVYRGIHREIRRRDYDNLRGRAYTGWPARAALAVRALHDLRRALRRTDPAPLDVPGESRIG